MQKLRPSPKLRVIKTMTNFPEHNIFNFQYDKRLKGAREVINP